MYALYVQDRQRLFTQATLNELLAKHGNISYLLALLAAVGLCYGLESLSTDLFWDLRLPMLTPSSSIVDVLTPAPFVEVRLKDNVTTASATLVSALETLHGMVLRKEKPIALDFNHCKYVPYFLVVVRPSSPGLNCCRRDMSCKCSPCADYRVP